MEQNFFSNDGILFILNKWKKHLIITVVIAIVLSIVFSSPFFIPPKYKSFAIVYPINLAAFSEESYTEQMLQIIESGDIKEQMFKSFNLAEHYKIDTADQYYYSKLIKEFDSNVTFSKTEFSAVEIDVYDTDPVKASLMVDSLIHFFNAKVRSMEVMKHEENLQFQKLSLGKMSYEIDSLSAIKRMHQEQYGLFNFGTQSKEATKRYIKLLAEGEGSTKSAEKVQHVIDNLKKKGIEDNEVSIKLSSAQQVFMNDWRAYGNELVQMEKVISYAQVVAKPFPSDKKSSPVRSLIVLLSAVSALLVSFFVIAYVESKNNK